MAMLLPRTAVHCAPWMLLAQVLGKGLGWSDEAHNARIQLYGSQWGDGKMCVAADVAGEEVADTVVRASVIMAQQMAYAGMPGRR